MFYSNVYNFFSVVTDLHFMLLSKIAELLQSSIEGIFTENILKYYWKIFLTLDKTIFTSLLLSSLNIKQ